MNKTTEDFIRDSLKGIMGKRYIAIGPNFITFFDDYRRCNKETIHSSNFIYDTKDEKFIKNRFGPV